MSFLLSLAVRNPSQPGSRPYEPRTLPRLISSQSATTAQADVRSSRVSACPEPRLTDDDFLARGPVAPACEAADGRKGSCGSRRERAAVNDHGRRVAGVVADRHEVGDPER